MIYVHTNIMALYTFPTCISSADMFLDDTAIITNAIQYLIKKLHAILSEIVYVLEIYHRFLSWYYT